MVSDDSSSESESSESKVSEKKKLESIRESKETGKAGSDSQSASSSISSFRSSQQIKKEEPAPTKVIKEETKPKENPKIIIDNRIASQIRKEALQKELAEKVSANKPRRKTMPVTKKPSNKRVP